MYKVLGADSIRQSGNVDDPYPVKVEKVLNSMQARGFELVAVEPAMDNDRAEFRKHSVALYIFKDRSD